MKFAKIVFWAAGIWGVLILTPLFFIFNSIGRNDPPPVTHPGFYYGFAIVGLAFQLVFVVIATDPMPDPRSHARSTRGAHCVPYHAVSTSSVEYRCPFSY